MPESDPVAISEEQLRQQSVPQEVLDQEAVAVNFAMPEHDSEGHVCTPECNHTQTEADQFADTLFSEIKPASHGEKGHVCGVNCQHNQVEADNFADSLFSDIKPKTHDHQPHKHDVAHHGEKGHVCTAECKHSQLEADEFASKLFETAEVAVKHGEKGHVCGVNCQHSQIEADRFADSLFSDNTRQEQTIKDKQIENTMAHQSQEASRITELGRTDLNTHIVAEQQRQAQQALLAETISDESSGTDESIKSSEVDVSISIEKNIVKADSVAEMIDQTLPKDETPVLSSIQQTRQKVEEVQITDSGVPGSAEVAHTNDFDPLYFQADGELISDTASMEELQQVELSLPWPIAESADEIDLDLENVIGGSETDASYIGMDDGEGYISEISLAEYDQYQADAFQPVELVDGMVMALRPSSETEPENELVNEKILEDIPELTPIEQALPAVVATLEKYIATDASVELEQATQNINELLSLIEVNASANVRDLPSSNIALIQEKLTVLADLLGLEPDLMEDLIDVIDQETSISPLAIEILHGLKKLLSVEYSLEFPQVSPTQDDVKDSSFIRELGKLLLSVLSYSRRPALQLASS